MSTGFDSDYFEILILLFRLLPKLNLVKILKSLLILVSDFLLTLLIDSYNDDCLNGLIFETLGVGLRTATNDDYL